MTDKQIKQLATKAWEKVWTDYLANQEDVSLNKISFYMGARKVAKVMGPIVKVLEAVQKRGLAHYEDCNKSDYQDEVCDCGMEAIELKVIEALENFKKECEK